MTRAIACTSCGLIGAAVYALAGLYEPSIEDPICCETVIEPLATQKEDTHDGPDVAF
jgi:hypothetical protein